MAGTFRAERADRFLARGLRGSKGLALAMMVSLLTPCGALDLKSDEKIEAIQPTTWTRADFTLLPAKFLGRRVRVMLPPGYDAARAEKYPLILALDGQNVFSPGGAFGSWDLDLAVQELFAADAVPECIVVAIDNTNERFAEYTPDGIELRGNLGRGGEFLTMLREELLPALAARFPNVTTDANERVFLGSSLGGLIGLEAAHEHRDVWGTVLAFSPAAQVAKERLHEFAGRPPGLRARLYLDHGNAGWMQDGAPAATALKDALLKGGAVEGDRFKYVVGEGDEHNEAAWRKRLPGALRWAFAPPVIAAPQ